MNAVIQGTQEWLQLRHGIPSASHAKELITSTGAASKSVKPYAEKLAADRFAGKPLDSFEGNASTMRGNELEPQARAWYEYTTGVDVEECGFFLDSTERYGASPDGLVSDNGLIEIKCQQSAGHVKTAIAYHKTKKPPSAYIQQIQMQMLVTDREWCDLVLYHPDLPCSIIRIEPIEELRKSLLEQIEVCLTHRDAILKTLQDMK